MLWSMTGALPAGRAGGGLVAVAYGTPIAKPGANRSGARSSLLTTQDLPAASTPVINVLTTVAPLRRYASAGIMRQPEALI